MISWRWLPSRWRWSSQVGRLACCSSMVAMQNKITTPAHRTSQNFPKAFPSQESGFTSVSLHSGVAGMRDSDFLTRPPITFSPADGMRFSKNPPDRDPHEPRRDRNTLDAVCHIGHIATMKLEVESVRYLTKAESDAVCQEEQRERAALRMGSLHDAEIAHGDHEPLRATRQRLGLRQPSPAVEGGPGGESGRGVPQPKTWRNPEQFMERSPRPTLLAKLRYSVPTFSIRHTPSRPTWTRNRSPIVTLPSPTT